MLPHRALAEAAPRRTRASSMTSSWYSVARWVSSTTTPAVMISGALGSPKWLASSVSERTEPLPAGVDEMAGRYVEDLVLGPNRDPQAALDFVQS